MILILTISVAILLTWIFRKRMVLAFDAIRFRGKYGVSTRISLDGIMEDHREKFKIETVQIAQGGIDMLVTTHGIAIKKHLNGLQAMMRAKVESAQIYFTVTDRELKILSVSGPLDEVLDAIKRVAYDLGEEKITQIRVCCASNQHLRKGLLQAGAFKTGVPAELIMR